MNWYALQCRSNAEKSVSRHLADDGIESYYPHLVIPASRGRRETEKKFFPGYLFARFDLAHHAPVSRITQVVSILGWKNAPVAIPDHEIEAVRSLVTKSVSKPELHPYLAVGEGDTVLVVAGPLQGLHGFVVRCKNATRVVVSVTMLARSISAEIDADWLEVTRKAA